MRRPPNGALGARLTRRALLARAGAGVAGVAGAGWLSGCSSSGRRAASPTTAPGGGDPLTVPAELRSAGGRLDVTLTAAPVMLPWQRGSRYALAYNGSVPGPTLRVRAGDTLIVRLQNRLDAPTNLHTHGWHVSPSGTSDNIFESVDPGAERVYEYVLPADHPSGTYWYHPHHHELVAPQLIGGLAGALIVEDALDDDPAMKATTERVLVLSDPVIGTTSAVLSASAVAQMAGRTGDVALVNGQLRPVVEAAAGTVERWRLVNASPSRYYLLQLSGAAMHLVASDHGRLDAPAPVSGLLLTPGQRAEVLVPLTAAGTVRLGTAEVSRGAMGGMQGGGQGGMGGGPGGMGATMTTPAADLLSVRVTGSAGPANPALPTRLRPLEPLDALVPDRRRQLTLGAMGMGMGSGMGAGMFVIDGRSFDPDRVDVQATLGTVEEWTLVNQSMMDHPFHLHVWPFRVVSRSDGSAPDPGWRDTVNVPAGRAVTIRVPIRDYVGRAVYHCHILDHEDLGMMGVIEVR